jgi:STE24 endopeptidase
VNEDKSTRYHRHHRRAAILSGAVTAAALILFVLTGASAALRASLDAVLTPWLTATTYVAGVVLALEVVQLPLAYYRGVTLERRYGLSTQSIAHWWGEQIKAAGVGLLLTLAAALVVWRLLVWSAAWWWVAAAVVSALVLVVLAQLAPVVLLPLFYDIKPLERESLSQRLVALADRAGARVLGVFEWRLSDRTRKANAALTGLGRTRRILVSDTLLAGHSDDEIEVILAHELGHHVHHDLWRSIAFDAALLAVSFFVADRLLTLVGESFGLTGKTDVAGLPIVAMAAGAAALALRPASHAFSRAHERRADRYALEVTRNAGAFIGAMKRLGQQNLAEEEPSRLVEWLFHSHPPVSARIEAARAFERGETFRT